MYVETCNNHVVEVTLQFNINFDLCVHSDVFTIFISVVFL